MLSHEELIYCIGLEFPNAKEGVNFTVAHEISWTTGEQVAPAIITSWSLPEKQPTNEEIEGYGKKYYDKLEIFRKKLMYIFPLGKKQFFKKLAKDGKIDNAEAIAMLSSNTIPQKIKEFVKTTKDQFDAEIDIVGDDKYYLTNETISGLISYLGYPDVYDFWDKGALI